MEEDHIFDFQVAETEAIPSLPRRGGDPRECGVVDHHLDPGSPEQKISNPGKAAVSKVNWPHLSLPDEPECADEIPQTATRKSEDGGWDISTFDRVGDLCPGSG